ncbi:hypothetical protein [Clostridium aestuarii]
MPMFRFYPMPMPYMMRQTSKPPTGPPPSTIPDKDSPKLKAVDPGAIKNCKYRYVYLWLKNGRSFWIWLTYVGKTSISGWRWTGFFWVYFGIDLKKIDSFICV